MLPAPGICERARLARDHRFDGRFVVAVVTTGIYCRPVCPARPPARPNVRYYPTPAAAQDAGYRPCLRCRPENARRLPEWTLGSRTVTRGLRYIETGFLDERRVGELAGRLGLSERQLNRHFVRELGATPSSLARAHRVELAKRLIDSSRMPFARVAADAGYGSVRRFNDELRSVFGRTPSALRRLGAGRGAGLTVHLAARPPYNCEWVLSFLDKRALTGIEWVDEAEPQQSPARARLWRRRVPGRHGATALVEVAWRGDGFAVTLPAAATEPMSALLRRVRRVFDLGADSDYVDAHLARDPLLAPWIEEAPGLRVPGAWDGFETGVRAILGQQVSVAAATTLANRLIAEYGRDGLFPDAPVLADVNPARIGLPGRRGAAIGALARAVADGHIELDECADPEALRAALCALPGVGPWTAAYVTLRVARDPDAFPDSDWVVTRMLGTSAAGARRRSAPWAPWRGYALMYLWYGAGRRREEKACTTP